jgi:hypothetical protein
VNNSNSQIVYQQTATSGTVNFVNVVYGIYTLRVTHNSYQEFIDTNLIVRSPEISKSVTLSERPPNIYVAGHVGTGASSRATLWVNGVAQTLSNVQSIANSVYVSGNDVYVVGAVGPGGQWRATMWRNGVGLTLSTLGSFANDVFVLGNDVFIAGEDNWAGTRRHSVYWKNGVRTQLSNVYESNNLAISIFATGNDVYVAGSTCRTSGWSRQVFAALWRNGQRQDLYQSHSTSIASSVFVSAGVVYVVGEIGSTGTLWRNGVAQTIPFSDGQVHSVFVEGGNVYIVGATSGRATLWVNNAVHILSTTASNAICVKVFNGDVYVAGRIGTPEVDRRATVWINGVAQTLSNVESLALSVFVSH